MSLMMLQNVSLEAIEPDDAAECITGGHIEPDIYLFFFQRK